MSFPWIVSILLPMSSITIYGADWCGDCRRAKQWFEHNEVASTWVDLEQNPEKIDEVIRYNNGRKNIPVVVFPDGTHLTEPADSELAAKLMGASSSTNS